VQLIFGCLGPYSLRPFVDLAEFKDAGDAQSVEPYIQKLANAKKVLAGLPAKVARVDKRLENVRVIVGSNIWYL